MNAIFAKRTEEFSSRKETYEKTLSFIPSSYKLWFLYLKDATLEAQRSCLLDPIYEETNALFDRALNFLYKMPRIWVMYAQFLAAQCKYTATRRTYDRALKTLPVTQVTHFPLSFFTLEHKLRNINNGSMK